MLQLPLKDNVRKLGTAKIKWLSSPTKGWNASDDLTDMDVLEAVVLDNWIVTERGCMTRQGFTEHVTGIGANVRTLMEHNDIDGTATLFATTATNIYDVTTAGAVGAAAVSSLTGSGVWSHVMFATAGGNFLVACNGTDPVQNFDGSTWTEPTITASGTSSDDFVQVTAHMTRLWFVEKNTLKVWYLPASAIAGTATAIDFGPVLGLAAILSRWRHGRATAAQAWMISRCS